jgi:hypothetical protein
MRLYCIIKDDDGGYVASYSITNSRGYDFFIKNNNLIRSFKTSDAAAKYIADNALSPYTVASFNSMVDFQKASPYSK